MSEKNNVTHLEKTIQKTVVVSPVVKVWELTSQIALRMLESDESNDHIADDIVLLLEKASQESREKIVNIPQTKRNFDIMIVNKNGKIDIILKKIDDGLEFDLSSLFPNNWYKFIPSQVDCYFNHSFTVWVNLDNEELRGFILGILHEIGHTHQSSPSKIFMLSKMLLVSLAYSKMWVFVQKMLQNYTYEVEEDILLDAQKSSYKERNAWAYALVQARKLEKLWFHVLSNFETPSEVSEFIGWNLATYDECLFYDMLDTFWDITPENIHELQEALLERPLFNKKTKNIYQIHTPKYE